VDESHHQEISADELIAGTSVGATDDSTARFAAPSLDDELPLIAAPAEIAGSTRTLSAEIGIRVIAVLVAVAAWAVPGLGHVITRRWIRGLIFFACAGGLALTGFALRGNVFPQHSTDPFGALGFLADASSGIFYFLAHTMEKAGPDVSRAAGDYGTRLIAAAGVLNLLGVADAYEIAMGRRA
jgi:hypothetical protein